MKEAIRMVPESIYDPEFPDTSHFRSGRGCHSALRRIKEEWGTSRWFLEFDIRKCFHTIDRLIPIFKEDIDDPQLFYKVFYAGRLVGDEKDPSSVPHSVLLSALPGNIYLHKLDREIGRIQHKYEIPIVQRIRSVLLRTGHIDDQSGEEASFNAPQDNRTERRDIQRFSLLFPCFGFLPTPRLRRDQKTKGVFPPSSAFLNKPSSLLCAVFLIEIIEIEVAATKAGRERCNPNGKDLIKYCKRKGLLIELGGEFIIRSEIGPARTPLKRNSLIRIYYARYAGDLLLGIVGAVELLIEIQKRIAHFLQSGLNLWVGSVGSTIAARSTVEFLGMVIRTVPPRTTPIQFLRELEKRLRVKHRIHITACHLRSAIHSKFRNLGNSIPIKQLTKGMSGTAGSLLDGVQLAKTLGTAGVRSPQVSVLGGTIKHFRQGSREISLLHCSGRGNAPSGVQQAVSRSGLSLYTASRKAAGEGGGHWARFISSELSIQIEAPIKKIVLRLRDRGIISRRRPWPIHAFTNVSDGDIINGFAGIAMGPLSYYRSRNNLYQVRTIVDHQIRWSAIFTPAHKHKSSARNIIKKYSKDSNIVNQEGGKTDSIELADPVKIRQQ
uniref:Maturase n=1 Tax=Lophophytum mirabile subsp. bolivianum TaxID=1813629 RepID=A0A830ZFN9_9MAGN|nr:maturase [Lophophytum mirabile subsp. bolivianum]